MGSDFTHSSPTAVLEILNRDANSKTWEAFVAEADEAEEQGLRFVASFATSLFMDMLLMVGPRLAGYDLKWMKDVARPVVVSMVHLGKR
jgi:uncharacterized membrane protein (UPF0127 family)